MGRWSAWSFFSFGRIASLVVEWANILVGGYLSEMALVGLAHRFRKYGLVLIVFFMAFVQNVRYFQGNGYGEEKEPHGLMPSAGARSKVVKSMGVLGE